MIKFPPVLSRAAASGLLLFAGVALAAAVEAQTPDSRWQPWLGCWTAGNTSGLGSPETNVAAGLVCVVPSANGAGVDLATVANGVVAHRERVNPTGARTPKTVDGCPGWESATWSADGRRLLLRSELVCANNVTVRGSGVFAISSKGEWILVQGNTVGANATARVVRYQAAGLELERAAGGKVDDSAPVHLVTATPGLSARSARIAAGDAVQPDDVLEVARLVDGPVAEAWLNEINQRFSVNAAQLVRLADAGLPPNMVDLMVALSYPQRFALERTERTPEELGNRGSAYGSGSGYSGISGRRGGFDTRWDCGYGSRMLSYGYYGDSCYPGFYGLSALGYYGAYGYGAYGYGPYGYGAYNNGYYFGRQPLVIIQRGSSVSSQPRGRAVNGSGYTRGSGEPASRGGSSASDRAPSSSTSSGSRSGSSSSGASTSTGSTGSGSSSGGDRTAKPRVPPG